MMQQTAMAGDDWLSDRDRRTTARLEAARKKAAINCARKLEAAAEALNEFLRACNECNDGSGSERNGIADGRITLAGSCAEYAGYLSFRYDRTGS